MLSCHKSVLSKVSQQYEAHSKSVDDDFNLPQSQLPRGHAGVATLCNKNHQTSAPVDGTHRVLVTEAHDSLVVINVYMPCRGGYTNDEFKEEVDQLDELCKKYSERHIILLGDFNIDLDTQKDNRASYLVKFLKENKLLESNQIHGPSFRQHSGRGQSRVDYIFLNEKMRRSIVSSEYNIIRDDPLNTSAHEAVLLKVKVQNQLTNLPKSETQLPKPQRLKWSKCDSEAYERTLEQYLCVTSIPSDPDLAIEYLTRAIKAATDKAVPIVNPKIKKAPWNPTIATFTKKCRVTDAKWKEAGCPPAPTDLFEERKMAKKQLRRAQRQQMAIIREHNLEVLHQASEANSNLFFSIVKKQRETSSTNTKELLLNDHLYTGDLLPAWLEHFSILASPSPNDFFTDERIERASQNVSLIRHSQQCNPSLPIPITNFEVVEAIKTLKKKKAADNKDLVSEHLQICPTTITQFLTPVINRMLISGVHPHPLKRE